jgi:hypothetical protein
MANDVAGPRRTKIGCSIWLCQTMTVNKYSGMKGWVTHKFKRSQVHIHIVNCGCGHCNHGMPISMLETFRPRGHPASPSKMSYRENVGFRMGVVPKTPCPQLGPIPSMNSFMRLVG